MTNDNLGEQFKGIAGSSLLDDAKDSIEKMQEVIKPHSDQVFRNTYMSDKDMLNHPAVFAHNSLFFSHSKIKDAVSHHNSGNWAEAIFPLMSASGHIMDAAKNAIELPWSDEDKEKFIAHFDRFHAKANEYINLYGDLEH